MDQSLSQEIKAVRDKIAAIERERLTLGEADFERRAELRDEEHDLDARLARLVETATGDGEGEAETKAAAHTDLTSSPRLPDAGASV